MTMNNETKTSIQVSIGDTSNALIALRAYGLTPAASEELLSHELCVATMNHGIIPAISISPMLIELFGEQHVEEALSYAYYFMQEYGLDINEYQIILIDLLKDNKPEELILSPDKIKEKIEECFEDAYERKEQIISSNLED